MSARSSALPFNAFQIFAQALLIVVDLRRSGLLAGRSPRRAMPLWSFCATILWNAASISGLIDFCCRNIAIWSSVKFVKLKTGVQAVWIRAQ